MYFDPSQDRTNRGVSGALYLQSAIAGANSRFEAVVGVAGLYMQC